MNDSARTQPLARFTVLDLTRVRSGPTAVRQLADWGANVIKIEAPASIDSARGMGGVSSVLYQVENRFCLSQPTTPISLTGGARLLPVVRGVASAWTSAIAQRSTSAMRRLYQFMKAEVSRLSVR